MTTLIQESAIDFGDAPTHPHPNKEDSIIYGSATDIAVVNSAEDGFDFIPAPDFSFFKIRGGAVPSTTGTPDAFADTEGDALIIELVADVPPNTGGDPSGVSYRVSVQLVDIVISSGEDPITANIGDILYWSAESSRWLYLESTTGDLSDYYTKAEVDAIILAQNPIGSVVLRMDAIDPGTVFGGTWELLTGAAELGFGDGTEQPGTVAGSTTQAIALANLAAHTHGATGLAGASHTHTGPSHAHAMPHTHTGPSHTHTGPSHTHTVSGTAASAGTHSHIATVIDQTALTSANGRVAGGGGVFDEVSQAVSHAPDHTHTVSGTAVAAGTGPTGAGGTGATGGVSTPNTSAGGTGATGSAGVGITGATASAGSGTALNIRSARILINVWQRTA